MLEPPKPTDVFCNPIIGRWSVDHCVCYLLICIAGSIALRSLQSIFKAWSIKHDDDCAEAKHCTNENKDEGYWNIYRKHFRGFSLRKKADLWLPTVIGLIELLAYPILLVTGQIVIIGAWMGIKTAGAFGGWKTSHTAFNRFLLFNLFNLILAYLFLTPFVHRIPCPCEETCSVHGDLPSANVNSQEKPSTN